MKQERIQEFTARITQGSRTDLIVIMYDVILEDIIEAKQCFLSMGKEAESKKPDYKNPKREDYRKEVLHAARFVSELMASLDYRFALSYELRSLYVYAHKCLMEAAFSMKTEKLDEVNEMMGGLKTAFLEVAKQDTSGPMMKNSQKITAGLTYGKNRLNEICIDPNESRRGFFA